METNSTVQLTPVPISPQPGQMRKISWPVSVVVILVAAAAVWAVGISIGNSFFWTDLDGARLQEQTRYYEQVVMENPNDPQQRVNLAFTYFQLERYDQALAQYKAALDIDPNFYPAYLNQGYLYIQLEQYDQALATFQEAAKLNPNDFKAHLNLGISFYNLAMYDQALEEVSIAQELNPGGVEIHYYAGRICEAQNDFQAAIEAYQKALEYDPNFDKARVALTSLGQ